jgi:hypothetical protein
MDVRAGLCVPLDDDWCSLVTPAFGYWPINLMPHRIGRPTSVAPKTTAGDVTGINVISLA